MDRSGRPRTYTAKDVLWRLRDQFQLRAVLLPLTGHYHSRGDVPARALAIRRRWWWLINRLRARGWDPLTTPQIHRQARYCPMTFLMVYGKPRGCRLVTACPFCWARRAAHWWDKVDSVFFRDAIETGPAPTGLRAGRAIELDDTPPASSHKARAVGYKLVTRTRTWLVSPYVTPQGGEKVDLLRDFYLARTTGKGAHLLVAVPEFVRYPEVSAGLAAIRRPGLRAGCFENIVADVRPGEDFWRVSVCQVWLVPAEADLSPITPLPGMTCTERVVVAPWRNQVMKAMARACRYPRAMLTRRHDAAPARQLLEARRGLRLAALFGDFRGNGREK